MKLLLCLVTLVGAVPHHKHEEAPHKAKTAAHNHHHEAHKHLSDNREANMQPPAVHDHELGATTHKAHHKPHKHHHSGPKTAFEISEDTPSLAVLGGTVSPTCLTDGNECLLMTAEEEAAAKEEEQAGEDLLANRADGVYLKGKAAKAPGSCCAGYKCILGWKDLIANFKIPDQEYREHDVTGLRQDAKTGSCVAETALAALAEAQKAAAALSAATADGAARR